MNRSAMNRTEISRKLMKKVGTQVMASMGLAMLCAVVALAQDPGAARSLRVSRRRHNRDRAPTGKLRWMWCTLWTHRRR